MNGMAQVSYRKLLFFSSCQESSPANLEPKLFAPFLTRRSGDRTHLQLHQLKRKLVRAALEETPETASFKRLCGAANQAVKLAWATSYPLLVFPCLFDEMVEAVRERFPQDQVSEGQSSLTSPDADLRFEGIPSVSSGPEPTSTGGCLWPPYQNTTRGNRTAGQTTRLPHIEAPALSWNELATLPEHDRPTRIHDNASVPKRPIASIAK